MRCPNCGAEAGGDAKFCQRCGYSYDQRAMMPQQGYIQPQPEGMSKTTLIVIILIVVLVVVPVVLSAILYIMVLGFGGTTDSTPEAMYYGAPITNGEQVTIVSITRTDVPWDDVNVQLNDGTHFAEWNPRSIDLDGGSAVTAHYAAEILGTLSVSLTVTDVGGNSLVSGSDYFSLTASPPFSVSTSYVVRLVYVPTGEWIGSGVDFTG